MQARNSFEYIDVFFRYMVSSRKICGVLSANGKRPVEGDHIYNNEDDDNTTIWYYAFFYSLPLNPHLFRFAQT